MTLHHRPLTIALALGLGMLVLAPDLLAQDQGSRPMTMRERRAQRMAELGRDQAQNAQEENRPAAYPNATRQSPDGKASPKLLPKLKKMQERFEKDDWAGVMADADVIGASPDAGPYDKSFAYSMAGNAAANLEQQTKAADYFARAIAANGLDNDSHFATMYNLAVIQFGEEKYAEALATMDRFLAETKSDKVEHLSFRAGILASMGRDAEAAAAYQALVAKNPDDKRLLMNAVAALQGAEKFEQANALLEDAFKRGMLTEERELRSLYVGYMNAQRWADAQRVIEDGVGKGILKPGPDLANAYQLLAQNAFFADKIQLAIDFYNRALPMATDGEVYLNLAKVLDYAGRKAEAKEAARQALAKGIKKPEEANRIIAR
ncbi:tetratricopeptide repeat protein [Thermomonas sp.]|uniref:tetratricopeptide repeat protein n=1 Tax=Thermomonas sp. TaxID=1971895 RepID=UPI002639BB23|nr:tetratricopeptide repeat protein [Thermomonas sp.]MCO5055415.1 tetratricopeptide repeat protein [Thermomonas sp.]HRO63243.1 tetratricopeptide repeat protein [Thermomonas sp.]